MFYKPEDGHGLPHNPFGAIVAPRPIGWISTRGADGQDNLAPYSFFNAVAYGPPQVMFASTGTKPDRDRGKDSVSNLLSSNVFCVNIVGAAQQDAMNQSSGAWGREVDEFALTSLPRAECETIGCSRVADAPANLECRVIDVITLKGDANFLILGEVTAVHIRDDCLRDGRLDVTVFQPLARLGYRDYARIDEVFELQRPGP
ncbi:MAG: flavin reductase family protein [Pseudomonadota bacterium]